MIENCELVANNFNVFINRGTALVNDCTFSGKDGYVTVMSLGAPDAKIITLSGDIRVSQSFSVQGGGTATVLAGTYNFDVTSYVDMNTYNVTNDGTIWTVIAK